MQTHKGTELNQRGRCDPGALCQLLPNLELGEKAWEGVSVVKGGRACRSPSGQIQTFVKSPKALLENVYYFFYNSGRNFCI